MQGMMISAAPPFTTIPGATAVYAGNSGAAPSFRTLTAADLDPAYRVAPTATANSGLLSLGSGPFDGSTSGFFNGSSAGTHIAINAASGFTGNPLHIQKAGVDVFKIDASGVVTVGTPEAITTTGAHFSVFTAGPSGYVARNTTNDTEVLLEAGGGAGYVGCVHDGRLNFLQNNANVWAIELSTGGAQARALMPLVDNTYDLGTGSIRVRNAYLGTSIVLGTTATPVTLRQAASRTLQVGAAASASPNANTLVVGESSRGTTDTNVAGANAIFQSGAGTGNATGSSILFQTPTATTTGTTAQAMATRLTLTETGATFSGQILAPSSALGIGYAFQGANGASNGFKYSPSNLINVVINGSNVTNFAATVLSLLGNSHQLAFGASSDAIITRISANVLAMQNADVAQEWRVYGATTGTKYASLKHDGTNALLTASSGGVSVAASGGTLAFYGVTPVSRQVVATGSTTDQVISALQSVGLFSQT